MSGAEATAFYAHAVVWAGVALPALPRLPDGASPVSVAEGAIAAVVSAVPRAVFTGPQAADPAWIEACAMAHHAVAAALPSPALPLAFGAIFSNLDAVTEWLRRHTARFADGLARVTNAAEWTLSLDVADAAATPAPVTDQAGPGLAFLRGRIAVREANQLGVARAEEAARRARLVLERHACAVHGATPRWTALVADQGRSGLEAALSALADEIRDGGVVLTLSGPWPPYATAREIADAAAV